MGIAAYNRGSAVIRRQIQADYDKGRDADLFFELTDLSAQVGQVEFGAESGIRFDSKGRPWLMNRLRDGWGEYGIVYPSRGLRAIAKKWRLWFVGWSRDAHGEFILVAPLPRK